MTAQLRVRQGVRRMFWVAVAIAVLLVSLPLLSQVNTGRISGAVTDQSGGAISGATVTVTDVARGESRVLTTDAAGLYAAPNLIPGAYTVRAEFKGFQTLQRENIDVGVGGDVRLDMTLQPGQQTQTVTVTESLPIMNTTNAQTGGTLDNNLLSTVPLNGRNYRWLAAFVPGVVILPGESTSSIAVNGSQVGYAVNNLIDGLYSMTVLNREPTIGGSSEAGDTTILPLDAIQEVNEVIQPKAEYGWNPGVTVSVGLKSGTNDIHGSAYAYGRDADLDARNPFALSRGPVAFEQFGGSIGGPIKKNKLFYFMAYEGFRVSVTTTSTETAVPTTASLGGNTSESIPDAIAAIVNAHNSAAAPAGTTTLNPLSLSIAGCNPALLPTSGTTNTGAAIVASGACKANQFGALGLFNNYVASTSVTDTFPDIGKSDNGLTKVDYHLNDHHALNASYIVGEYNIQAIGNSATSITQPWWSEVLFVRSQDLRAVEIWTPNSSWLNEARVGWDHSNRPTGRLECAGPNWTTNSPGIGTPSGLNGGPNYETQYGLYSAAPECGNPTITISTAYSGQLGFSNARIEHENSMQGADNLSYTHGAHQFKFGVDVRAESMIGAKVLTNQNGSVAFGGSGDAAFTGATQLESFLAGIASAETLRTGSNVRNVDLDKIDAFAQDDWRITPRLTLNLGIRQELQTAPSEADGLIGNFDPSAPSGMIQNNRIWKNQWDFSPHLGVSWDVTGKGTTVIRAGGGLAYDTPQLMTYISGGAGNDLGSEPTGYALINQNGTSTVPKPGNITSGIISAVPVTSGGVVTTSAAGQLPWNLGPGTTLFTTNSFPLDCGDGFGILGPGTTPTGPFGSAGTNPLNPSTCNGDGEDPNIKFYRFISWNLNYQHAFTNSLSVDAGYVGSHSYDIVNTLQINQPSLGANGGAAEQPRRPYSANCPAPLGQNLDAAECFPWFSSVPYLMNYGSGNYAGMQLNLQERASHGFTFNIAYTLSRALAQGAPLNSLAPFANPSQTYGPTTADARDHFTFTANYAIRGRKSPGQLLEGWEINGSATFLSALPVTALDTTNDESGTGVSDPWTMAGNASDINQYLHSVSTVPCFGVAGSGFAKAPCTTVTALPQACLNASMSEVSGPTNTGLTSNLTATETGSPSEPQNSPLFELYKLGCYFANGTVIVPPALGTFGTMRSGSLRGPGQRLVNGSVTKDWKFRERIDTQFRVEVFNLFNRTQYAGAGTNLGQPSTLGVATQTPDVLRGNAIIGSGGARDIQLSLRITY